MIRFKPVSNNEYAVCDSCRTVTDRPSIFFQVDKDTHLCNYCDYARKLGSSIRVVSDDGKKVKVFS